MTTKPMTDTGRATFAVIYFFERLPSPFLGAPLPLAMRKRRISS